MVHPTESQVEEISFLSLVVDTLIVYVCLPLTNLLVSYVTPNKRGYFCDDESLRYPLKESTISKRNCDIAANVIPILTIIAVELWFLCDGSQGRRIFVAGRSLPLCIVRCVRHVLLFCYGMGAVVLLVKVGKVTVGRLRPNFHALCKPNEALCNSTTKKNHVFIENYECNGDGVHDTSEVHYSFPSEHTARSFYAALFIVMYLEHRTRWSQRTIVVKTAYETVAVTLAWFIALTRITDHKHHWGDVTAGGILGAATAWFWVLQVLRLRADVEARNDRSNASAGGSSKNEQT